MSQAAISQIRHRKVFASLALMLLALTAACNVSDNPPLTAESPTDPATISAESLEAEQSPSIITTTQETHSWLEALSTPAAGIPLPDQFFFSNGPDLWLATGDGAALEILTEMRIGPHADTPDGSRTAVVFTTDLGSRSAEEIRFVDAESNVSEPIYGPVFLDGPGSKPPVKSLVWTADGQRLAIVRHDASVSGLQVSGESASLDSYPLFEADTVTDIEKFVWSPSGEGAILLGRDESGIGRLHVLTGDGSASIVIAPTGMVGRSIGAVDWIPEQGNLIIAEDDGARNNPNAGSLFSLSVNGNDRELLISSGEFGPVVAIPVLRTSSAGDWVAFAVYAPGANGSMEFDSLWIFEFATSVLIPIPVSEGFRVTDIWWTSRGLSWRGVDINAPATQQAWEYVGTEPFTIVNYNIETGQSSKLMSSSGR